MTTTLTSAPHGAEYWRTQLPMPDVCDLPLGPRQACEEIQQTASEAASSVLDDLVTELGESFGTILRFLMTWWTALPSPQLTDSNDGPGTALSGVREYTSGLQVVLLTAGILFAAARLALAKRGGTAGEAQETFLMLARAVFASMTFAAVITAGTRAGDGFAEWVIFDASRGDMHGAVAELVEFDLESRSGLGTGVLLVLFLLGIISTLIQLVMLVIRQALLILVVAVLPIAAAASGTGPGSQAYKRLLAWSLAFVLWKPVGALVYAIAFTVAGRDQQDPQMVLLGLILLVMSVIVLPALIRLVAPAVATLGGGGGATAVLAGGAAGVAMASIGGGSGGRKVSEGENAPSGSPPSTPSGSSAGGGGRPMTGGGGSAGPSTSGESGGSAISHRAGGGGSARPSGGTGQGKAASTNAAGAGTGAGGGGGGGGGGAAAGAGAGPAGAAVMGAQMGVDLAQHGVSAIDSQVRDASEAGWDPDALGPGEVRR
ncbi:hypothetical protein ABZV58_28690 [Nocardia sp. NPDC004654]|uniref:hypothetical protein n=1 Tax=Nocardia sp. NPDC004654 TaxID=3154776 RepID=UPI00339DFE05